MRSWLHRCTNRFYWAVTDGLYLHISAGQERPCSPPYIGYSCKILRCWHTPRRGKSSPESTHPHLGAEISNLSQRNSTVRPDSRWTNLRSSARRQKVQIRACSSHKRRNQGCWCTCLRCTRYCAHTHWHLTERHTPLSHTAAPQAGMLPPTTQHNSLQTFAASFVWCDLVTVVTGTFVGAIQVDTVAMETDTREETLIHVWRKGSRGSEKGGIRKKEKH